MKKRFKRPTSRQITPYFTCLAVNERPGDPVPFLCMTTGCNEKQAIIALSRDIRRGKIRYDPATGQHDLTDKGKIRLDNPS